MDRSEEMAILWTEHRRLRLALDKLEERLAALEHVPVSVPPAAKPIQPPTPPPIPTPAPEPVVAPKPTFDSTPAIERPRPTPRPAQPPKPPESRDSLELRLGRVWLVRIGIVILLTGLVFLGNYAYQKFIDLVGPAGKLFLLYVAGTVLCLVGGRLARKHASLLNYGRVLLAGGCATIYYATYASHFVAALRVIQSDVLGGALLLVLGGAFVAWANRLRSQTLAAATVVLSFYTAAINPVAGFSLFSNLVISIAAVALLARRRWASVTFLSLLGTYGSFAFWRLQQTHALFPAPIDASAFWPAVLFPAAYWIVHTAAVLLRRVETLDPSARPVFLTLNNAAFFALAGPTVAGNYPSSFWLAAVLYGAILIALAAVAARTSPAERYFDGSYLAQGLALIFLGLFVYKFTNAQFAISFALLSVTLISFSRLRHGGVYRFFAGVAGIAATWAASENFLHGTERARLVAAAVAAILVSAAWMLKRLDGMQARCDWRALGFALLAGCLVVPACFQSSDLQTSGLAIAGVAIAAMLTLRLHRLPEAAYVAQPLALCGQFILLAHGGTHSMPGATVLISAALALAAVHGWQSQKLLPLPGRTTWQSFHCIVPLILALSWNFQHFAPTDRGPILALIALLVLIYALSTRTLILAVAGIPFTLVGFGHAANAVIAHADWRIPSEAVALLAAQSIVVSALGARASIPADIRAQSAAGIRATSLLVLVSMVFVYLSGSVWFLTLTAAAFAFFLLTCRHQRIETVVYAVALAAAAAVAWVGRLSTAPPQAIDLLGFAMIAAAQQIGKRRFAGAPLFDAQVQALLCVASVTGTWIVLHRLLVPVAGGFLITVSWSLLALAVLSAGFALKERAYRILGLTILAAAVGRIVIIDVWQLDTLFRILSFMVLGVVLLLLGFVYNRHAETLRRWL